MRAATTSGWCVQPALVRLIPARIDGASMTDGPNPRFNWYRCDDLEADGELVIFWWPWGEGIGMKKWTRRGRKVVYRVRRTPKHFEDLPEWARPHLWRPLREDLWPYELPEPVPIRSMPEIPKPQVSPRKQREEIDVTITRYSPSGEISRREAEIRMIRFIRTERVTPWTNPTALRVGWPAVIASIAEMIASWDEAKTYPINDPRPSWTPTPKDIADSEIVVQWFCALNPPALGGPKINSLQAVLIARANLPTPTWDEMAVLLDTDDPKGLYERALNVVERVANGQPAFPGVFRYIPDPIEELRRRNRLYRERAESI